jgi:hypothetical protein
LWRAPCRPNNTPGCPLPKCRRAGGVRVEAGAAPLFWGRVGGRQVSEKRCVSPRYPFVCRSWGWRGRRVPPGVSRGGREPTHPRGAGGTPESGGSVATSSAVSGGRGGAGSGSAPVCFRGAETVKEVGSPLPTLALGDLAWGDQRGHGAGQARVCRARPGEGADLLLPGSGGSPRLQHPRPPLWGSSLIRGPGLGARVCVHAP